MKEPFNQLVAGCDEIGRGCLTGPVVAASVILPLQHWGQERIRNIEHAKDLKSFVRV